jgi:hypothetical protein
MNLFIDVSFDNSCVIDWSIQWLTLSLYYFWSHRDLGGMYCSRKKEKGVHFWSKIENDLNLTFLPVYLWLSVNVNLPWPFPHDQQCKIMVSVVISSLVNLEFQHRVGQTQCYILWLVYLLVFLLAHVHSVRTKQRLGFSVGIFAGV